MGWSMADSRGITPGPCLGDGVQGMRLDLGGGAGVSLRGRYHEAASATGLEVMLGARMSKQGYLRAADTQVYSKLVVAQGMRGRR